MKYVFFGSPEFAAIILKKLIDSGMPPAAVVCNPDRPVGRKKIITPPPVKQRIMNYESSIRDKIKVLQPEKLDKNFLDSLFIIHDSFDLFVVAAYSKIFPKEVIEIPRLGTIGVHPSLLPKHRGPTPIQTAILNGDAETGVSLFLVDEKVDHGPILSNVKCQMSNDETYESLHNKLAELGGDLLIKTLPKFAAGEIEPKPQNETEATCTKKFTSPDVFLDLKKDNPVLIERKVRALNPEPGVFTLSQSKGGLKRVKILEAELVDGKLKLKKIQEAGGKPRAALE